MAKKIDILINVRTAQFNKGIKQANQQLGGFNRTLSRIGRSMAAFAALFVTRAFLRGLGEATRAFAEFEKGIANIAILLGDDIGRLGEWEEAVEGTARKLGLATQDLLKAGFDIQSATNDTTLSLELFRQASRLAVAGGSDVASTVKGALTLNESFAKSFKSVADEMDFLIVAQKKARANIGELSIASSKFIGQASAMGIKVEELFAVFAQLTRGTGNVREASTQLSAILGVMQKPTAAMIRLAKEQFGTSIQQAVRTEGLIKVLRALNTVTAENISKVLSRRRAVRGFALVRQDLNTIEETTVELINREGAVQEKLGIQLGTTQVKLNQLGQEWQTLMRGIGDGIAGTGLIDFLREAIKEFNNLIAAEQKAGKESKSFFDKLPQAIISLATGAIQLGDIIAFGVEAGRKFGESFTKGIEEGTVITPLEFESPITKALDVEGFLDNTLLMRQVFDAALKKMEDDGLIFESKWKAILEGISKIAFDVANQISASFGTTMAKIIVDGQSAASAFKEFWQDVARTVISLIAKMIAKMVILLSLMATSRLFGFGGTFDELFRTGLFGFQEGGIVPGRGRGDVVPALLEPGELVVPRDQVSRVLNDNRSSSISVSMEGAFVLDDPIQVERLWREKLRDFFREEVRNRRDVFV